MLEKLFSLFGVHRAKVSDPGAAPVSSAAAGLPDIVDPKVSNRQLTQRTKTTTGDQKLAATDRRTASLDLLSLRNGTSTKSTIRDLAAVSPDLSASVYAYQRMVVTRNFSAVARNLDGTLNGPATELTQQLLARFNYLTDYTDGFSGMSSLHALAESLAMELRLYGACSAELVLDKARMPNRIVPISTTQVEFWDDGSGYVYPMQRINGVEIDLDQPTFFYEALDQDLLQAYADPPMEAALQSVLADTEYTNDLRRTIKRALHPRLTALIDSEKFLKQIPLDIRGDADKTRAYQNDFIAGIETTVNGLEPDDALVSFDTITFDYLNNGNVTLANEWKTVQEQINAKMATGTKAPPAVLGHGADSSNIASTETLLFMRYCEGVQNKINSLISRALTLGVRLLGQDVYVHFEFDRVDLRPESELEAFRVMKQSRILELLSIGLIGDEEAAIALTGRMPRAGMEPLSGTFFKAGSTDPNAVEANPLSNTSTGPGGPRDSKTATPTQAKGPVTRVK